MLRLTADEYNYHVILDEDEGLYEATCDSFPGVAWLASTPTGAVSGLRGVLNAVLDGMYGRGENPPDIR